MSSHERSQLDAWITREQEEDGFSQWCVEEDCNVDDCTEPDAHAASWISLEEKCRNEREDYEYDLWHDEH